MTTTIGPMGGVAEFSETASTMSAPFRVRVFAGSLSEETVIKATELFLAPPEDFLDFSPVYRVEPEDLEFVTVGEITIPWRADNGTWGTAPDIYHSESPDGPYERMADSYVSAGFSQATLLRSGYFFVGGPKPDEAASCP